MQKTLMAFIAIFFVVTSGVVHGLISHRWSETDEFLRQAVARIDNLPAAIGDWKLKQEHTISKEQLQVGEIKGYMSRTFVNEADGRLVNVIIVCGRPGPISVHTPDVCFRGQGMRPVRDQEKTEIRVKGSKSIGECWHTDFASPNAASAIGVGTFWTWTADGNWSAPANPRIEFAGNDFLYKMYVTYAVRVPGEQSTEDNPARDFMAEWIPAVREVLFPDSE